jgi:nucleotide-binding universal stress UspA family protein
MKTAATPSRSKARRSIIRTRAERLRGGDLQVRNILVPIDFSKPSLEAIEYALPLIKRFGAEMHLVHVFEPDYPLSSMLAMPLIVPELEVGRRVRRHLQDVAKKYSVELRRENIHVIKGLPFEEICRLARDLGVDLIVTSTRGNTGLKHLALGSTAERVVRFSPCPVLVLRPSDKKKSGRNGKVSKAGPAFSRILVPIDFSECSMEGLAYETDSQTIRVKACPTALRLASVLRHE